MHRDEDQFGARWVCFQCGRDYEVLKGEVVEETPKFLPRVREDYRRWGPRIDR